jgi:PIF1-like helicase
MAFFKANQIPGPTGDLARSLTYHEFPNHFAITSDVITPQSKVWTHRQRHTFAIGRMVHVGPTAGERFYLRTLLMIVKGPISFDDLKTVNGETCQTFHEACLRRGLLEDDREWEICLEDAAHIKTGSQLRHLFTTLLLFCTPAQPNILWQKFRDNICDDLRHKLHNLGRIAVTQNDVYDFGLYLIDNILHDTGHALSDFPSMPHFHSNWSDTVNNRLISQQLNYDPQTEGTSAHQLMSSLDIDQQHAFEQIWQSITQKQGKLFFIDGFGGCGKTYLYQTICHAIRAEGIIVLCVASTGLACLLLPGGQTAHSMFKIPIDALDGNSVCNIAKESLRADLLRITEAVIFYECLMTHRHCFEALDRTFQDIRNCRKRFGGLTMIFGGDFQQILPVVPKGSRADIVDACLQKSYLWSDIIVLKLRINMRLENSPEDTIFSEWLLDVGHGHILDDDQKIHIPSSMVTFDENELINKIYEGIENIQLTPPPLDYFLDHAILAPRNIDVRDTNDKILEKMCGSEMIFDSADTLEDEGEGIPDDISQEFLRSLEPSSLPLSQLKVKIGCPLILLRNLDPTKGLCNGTRMVLLQAYRRILEVMIMGGDHHGEKAFIPRIILKSSSQQYPFILRRRQFPVRLSFAMTINKAEGQSLKHVGIHLISPFFVMVNSMLRYQEQLLNEFSFYCQILLIQKQQTSSILRYC